MNEDQKQNQSKQSGTVTDKSSNSNNSNYQSPFMKLDKSDPSSNPPPPPQPGSQKTPQTSPSGQPSAKSNVPTKSATGDQPAQNTQAQTPVQGGGFENFISGGEGSQPPKTPQSKFSKKSATGKYIATILGIMLLLAGVGVGVYLVQRNQEIRKRAASSAECEQSTNCIVLEDPDDSGSLQVEGIVYNVFLTAQQIHSFDESVTDDGCYRVNIEGDSVSWERYGDGPDCKEISNIQIWTSGGNVTTPSLEARCLDIRIYDTGWNQLASDQLSQLSPGDTIRFAVNGSASEGSIDQARFTINGEAQTPTTNQRTETGEFYQEYTIPEGTQTFTVNAQLYHSSVGWF